ncbi:hypothetical protein BDV23DRAFT_167145 [Aspergillus alliaceus]|uniref:CsbD-like domain-containing protein n=1 Tax=Petromyces alliaceus TaxID=209559 RepID=A0A5N7BR31_PETAA|nr:hypothetical protein BDV23DRAFT_167145 [Aspergillus alliaceus]
MEHAGDRIKENLEYAKGQAKDAFGKVFHQESRPNDESLAKGDQPMLSKTGEAQQAKSDVKEAMSK